MNSRLLYWLKAGTAYGLHSPYMYALYGEVLSVRLRRADRRRVAAAIGGTCRRERQRYGELLFKLANYFDVVEVLLPVSEACMGRVLRAAKPGVSVVVSGEADGVWLKAADGQQLFLVEAPRRLGARWCRADGSLVVPQGYNVSVDLYDTALFIANGDLASQQFVLKTGVL